LLEFSVFFLLPVSFFTWFVNRKAVFIVSAAGAAIILGINLASPTHAAHPRVGYWNALVWLGFFLPPCARSGSSNAEEDRQLKLIRNMRFVSGR